MYIVHVSAFLLVLMRTDVANTMSKSKKQLQISQVAQAVYQRPYLVKSYA